MANAWCTSINKKFGNKKMNYLLKFWVHKIERMPYILRVYIGIFIYIYILGCFLFLKIKSETIELNISFLFKVKLLFSCSANIFIGWGVYCKRSLLYYLPVLRNADGLEGVDTRCTTFRSLPVHLSNKTNKTNLAPCPGVSTWTSGISM